jgi:hypothetical protein
MKGLEEWNGIRWKVKTAHAYTPSYLGGWDGDGGIMVGGQHRQIVLEIPISKTTRAQWARGMAQEVQPLICKSETLVQTPVTPPLKKNIIQATSKWKILSIDHKRCICLAFVFYAYVPDNVRLGWI